MEEDDRTQAIRLSAERRQRNEASIRELRQLLNELSGKALDDSAIDEFSAALAEEVGFLPSPQLVVEAIRKVDTPDARTIGQMLSHQLEKAVAHRFTQYTDQLNEEAFAALVAAHEGAIALRCSFVGTEHLLLGILRQELNPAVKLLRALNVTGGRVSAVVQSLVRVGGALPVDEINLAPRTKHVIELATAEAKQRGDLRARSEDLLVALTISPGLVGDVLRELGVADLEELRRRIREVRQ